MNVHVCGCAIFTDIHIRLCKWTHSIIIHIIKQYPIVVNLTLCEPGGLSLFLYTNHVPAATDVHAQQLKFQHFNFIISKSNK